MGASARKAARGGEGVDGDHCQSRGGSIAFPADVGTDHRVTRRRMGYRRPRQYQCRHYEPRSRRPLAPVIPDADLPSLFTTRSHTVSTPTELVQPIHSQANRGGRPRTDRNDQAVSRRKNKPQATFKGLRTCRSSHQRPRRGTADRGSVAQRWTLARLCWNLSVRTSRNVAHLYVTEQEVPSACPLSARESSKLHHTTIGEHSLS